MIHINTELLSVLGGTLIPLLVGLLTKDHAPRAVKSVGLAGLAAVAGAASTAVAGGGNIVWQDYAVSITVTWVSAVATYYGLWEPTGVAPKVQQVTGRFGVGPKHRTEPVEINLSWTNNKPEA